MDLIQCEVCGEEHPVEFMVLLERMDESIWAVCKFCGEIQFAINKEPGIKVEELIK
jgi:uncharacterized Zn finger protein